MKIIKNIITKRTPTALDYTLVNIDGVDIYVYGILHGVTGGPNKEYRKVIHKTISEAPGIKYCEKSMLSMYDGLDFDVNDWLVFKASESFRFALDATINPVFLYRMISTAIREKMTETTRFGSNGVHSINDVCSSLKFHLIDPTERRALRGIPSPEEYFKLNFFRRNKWLVKRAKKNRFFSSDKDWKWLDHIEPNANIPYRSIHMIEYTAAHAKSINVSKASLFVGDIHHSDIKWYSDNRDSIPDFIEKDREDIVNQIENVLKDKSIIKQKKKLYLLSLSLGVSLSWIFYIVLYFIIS